MKLTDVDIVKFNEIEQDELKFNGKVVWTKASTSDGYTLTIPAVTDGYGSGQFIKYKTDKSDWTSLIEDNNSRETVLTGINTIQFETSRSWWPQTFPYFDIVSNKLGLELIGMGADLTTPVTSPVMTLTEDIDDLTITTVHKPLPREIAIKFEPEVPFRIKVWDAVWDEGELNFEPFYEDEENNNLLYDSELDSEFDGELIMVGLADPLTLTASAGGLFVEIFTDEEPSTIDWDSFAEVNGEWDMRWDIRSGSDDIHYHSFSIEMYPFHSSMVLPIKYEAV